MKSLRLFVRLVLILGTATWLAACPAVYPEFPTRIRKAMTEQALDPPPPDNMMWMKFESARIPERARNGKTWEEEIGKKPDPYAILFINDKEVFRTPVEKETLEPTWKNGPRGNLRIEPSDKLRVEVWDSNTITDKPLGVRDIGKPSDEFRLTRRIRVNLDAGGEVIIAYEPARAMLGLGLWYEIRTESAFITRMMPGSAAERAGIKPGDEILKINGKDVKSLGEDGIRSGFGAVPSDGLKLMLRHEDGTILDISVKEGAVYPAYQDSGNLE